MKKSIDEETIRQYYELLDQRETEIRVFEPTPHSVFVHNADEFIGVCKRYNGRCNVYVGINERRKGGTKDKDVIKLRLFYFDIDPQRQKNTSATDKQKDKALKLTMKIAEHLDKQGYKHITIGDSGNGYHIYLRLKPIDVNEKNWEQVKKRWKAFGDGVREKFGGKYECNVDPVFNLSRISKVLGTLSVKGKVQRLSEFIQFDSEVNEGLREDILTISEHPNPPNTPPTKAQPPNEERFNELLRKDDKLRELYEGKIAGYPSRSEAEQALVCKLVWYEFPDEQIKEIMQTARIGKWQESREQYRDLTLRKAREKYVNSAKDEKLYPARVSELKADFVGKKVSLEVQVTGEKLQKALPKTLQVECTKCNEVEVVSLADDIENTKDLLLSLIFKRRNVLKDRAQYRFEKIHGATCGKGKHKIWYTEEGYIDYAELYVRDLPQKIEKFDERASQSRRIYLVGEVPPTSKKVGIIGSVIVEPQNRDISVLADEIRPLENVVENFHVKDEDKDGWLRYFAENDGVAQEINPDIIHRELAKEAVILLLHSPPIILDISGKHIRGCLRILFYGDTKTGKSQIAKDVVGEIDAGFRFGEYVIGETSSRAGITYTIDTDKKTIIWGALPLNDLGLVVIDGLHQMFSEEMKELREALENQKIKVCRSQSGEALARTRILGCFNPDKPMAEYIYPVMGITDNYIFSSHPEVTRWDMFVPFAISDVPQGAIARRGQGERPIPLEVFTRHVLWAWSRKPEQICYLDGAKEHIIAKSEEIMEEYTMEVLPLVHNGFRDLLTRLAVAVAAERHSTNKKHELICVGREHVEEAAEIYTGLLGALELSEYKWEEEGNAVITPESYEAIITDLGELELGILHKIKVKPGTSTQLAETLDVSTETVKRHYKVLRKHNLIKTSPHRGVALTIRGVRFLRMLIHNKNRLGTENVANTLNPAHKGSKNNLIVLRILRELPSFVNPLNPDKEVTLAKEDVVSLPANIAERLIEEGYATEIGGET